MIVLGMGSNLGDKLAYLQRALKAIQAIPDLQILQVSPLYQSQALLPDNAPPAWDRPYLNLAIACETKLDPFDLLQKLKTIEWSIGRKPEKRHWGPREIDIDILVFHDQIIDHDLLTVPHINLLTRPFALWPLADVAPLWQFPLPGVQQGKTAAELVEAWGSRFSGQAPFQTKQIPQRIDTPALVGILNITPDSFSDGGRFMDFESAWQQLFHLVESGAQVIDIGAESTAPHAQPLTPAIEWERLAPILTMLKEKKFSSPFTPKISIDTRHHQVAEKALALGVDWINDVSGLDDPNMRSLLAAANVDCVVMHHLSIPERRGNVLIRQTDPVTTVLEWGKRRLDLLEKKGFALNRLIFDPGIGFGKMAEQSLLLLKQAGAFQSLGTRVLIGHSRKTFLSLFTDKPFAERDVETLAVSLALAHQPIDYLRVHNVEWCARGLKAFKNFTS